MRWLALLSIIATFLVSVSVAQEGEGEPEVLPEEVIAPPAAWTEDWGGNPPPWFEDPMQVDCAVAPEWCGSESVQAAQNASAGDEA